MAELSLSATLERRTVVAGPSTQHAVLSVVAPPSTADRAPVNLVAVLDRSGSMQGEKLRLVLETTRFMLQHLRPTDRLGVVSYDTEVRTDTGLTRCDEAGKAAIEQAIARIQAGSCTNLSGGLLEGLALHSGRAQVTFGNTFTPSFGAGGKGFGKGGPPNMQRMQRRPMQMQRNRNVLQDSDSDVSMSSSGSEGPNRVAPTLGVLQQGTSMLSRGTSMLSNLFGNRTPAPAARQTAPQLGTPPTPGKWAVELRGAAEVVASVQYTLPGGEVVTVSESPFRVEREEGGPGTVVAVATMTDGQTATLSHDLQLTTTFRRKEHFKPVNLGLAAAPVEAGVVRSTLLFTDGLANEGIQDTEGICSAARAVLESTDAKSTIHTFGFGADHNAEMLRAIAQVGDGEYFFIESQDGVADSFGEAIGGLLSTTHQNIQVTVTPAAGVSAEALTTFATSEEAGSTVVTLGDLFAEERRDVLLRLSVPEGTAVCTVTARAYSLAAQQFITLGPVDVAVARGDQDDASDPDVTKHVYRHLATGAMDAARQAAGRGDLATAREGMAAAETTLAAAPQDCPLTAGLLADLRDAQSSMARESEYRALGSKKLALMSKMHGKQRACAYEASPATDLYSGSAQRAMKTAFKGSVR